MKSYLVELEKQPIVCLLVFNDLPLVNYFSEEKEKNTPEALAHLIYALLLANVKSTFHKINIHAALTPADLELKLVPVFAQAKTLLQMKQDECEETATSVTVSLYILRSL